MYGVIVTESYSCSDGWGDNKYTYQSLIEFDTEEKFTDWIRFSSSKYKNYRAIKFEPLEVETKIVVKTKLVKKEISQLESAGH